MVEWCDQWFVSLPPSDEPPTPPSLPAPLSTELPVPHSNDLPRIPSSELLVILPPPKVHREQVIKDDPVVQIEESDGSGDDLEQIDDHSGVLDHQDG